MEKAFEVFWLEHQSVLNQSKAQAFIIWETAYLAGVMASTRSMGLKVVVFETSEQLIC